MHHPLPLQDAWQSFREFQGFLGNQTFLDPMDYQRVHAFKRDVEKFMSFIQLHADKREKMEAAQAEQEDQRLVALWNDTAEKSFKGVQESLRLFSIRSDA